MTPENNTLASLLAFLGNIMLSYAFIPEQEETSLACNLCWLWYDAVWMTSEMPAYT